MDGRLHRCRIDFVVCGRRASSESDVLACASVAVANGRSVAVLPSGSRAKVMRAIEGRENSQEGPHQAVKAGSAQNSDRDFFGPKERMTHAVWLPSSSADLNPNDSARFMVESDHECQLAQRQPLSG